MFTFSVGSQSMNTMLITPAAQNKDATAFQLTGILYNLWLSMKMDVSSALKLILSKIVNPCLTMSPWIQEDHLFLLQMTEEVQELLKTSIFVNFHHTSWYPPCTHTLLYPSCTRAMLGTVFTNHSSAIGKSRIVSCWFSKTSSITCAVFTFS